MNQVTFKNDMTVELVEVMGSDLTIARAAWVSTLGERAEEGDPKRVAGLINYLMRDSHMSPFEHASMTFRITAPIFVLNQHVRHRALKFNLESGRYTELKPVFWVPGPQRKLVQKGKPGHYEFFEGSEEQYLETLEKIADISQVAFDAYQDLINSGVAREVARALLPLNIYTTAYVTADLRNLMHFLTLRRFTEDSTVPTHPQAEIAEVAEKYEEALKFHFPLVHEAFIKNGRNV